MVFSSLEFLFLYLPLTLMIYYAVPRIARNAVLFLVSLVFYGWGEPVYILLMLATILFDYLFGLLVGTSKEKGKSGKPWLIVACVFNVSLLVFFKYTDFFISNLRLIPAFSSLQPLGLELPIGISFYVFQALSYVIDVYRNDARVQKNPISFGAYVTQFPQLIAGPIVRYQDVDDQLRTRNYNFETFALGIRTFACGLGKKVLLANSSGAMWEYFCSIPNSERGAILSFVGLVFFSFQIYFDFSGYSDMAIGLGRMLGFEFPVNFNYPYISESITEFWRRWHITLGTWFREYVYIPLGGNRCSPARRIFNVFVVWLLTGMWHGASWNYIIWGLYFFVILMTEKLFLLEKLKKAPRALCHIYSLVFILGGWLIFAFKDVGEGAAYFSAMIGFYSCGADVTYELARSAVLLCILAFASLPTGKKLYCKLVEGSRVWRYVFDIALIAVILLSVAYLVKGMYNPFLYFDF